MTGWLLDTNVISELKRPRPNTHVTAFVLGQRLDSLFISVVTLAELRFGIERALDSVRRSALNEWLTHAVRPMFVGRILSVGEDVMLRWRLLVDEGRTANHTYTQPDLILAATALHHGLTMVTRDTADFARTRVPVFNPWIDAIPISSGSLV